MSRSLRMGIWAWMLVTVVPSGGCRSEAPDELELRYAMTYGGGDYGTTTYGGTTYSGDDYGSTFGADVYGGTTYGGTTYGGTTYGGTTYGGTTYGGTTYGGTTYGGTAGCCDSQLGSGCEDLTCETEVCAIDPYCCDQSWDELCAEHASSTEQCGCSSDTDSGSETGDTGDCCMPTSGAGCDDPSCEAAVCADDSQCCDVEWDDVCVMQASDHDASCGCGELGTSTGDDGSDSGATDTEDETPVKVLITGFGPFGTHTYNVSSAVLPSLETSLDAALPDRYQITTRVLRVQSSVRNGRRQAGRAHLTDGTYDVVISMGIQPDNTIRVETQATNGFVPLTGTNTGGGPFPIQGTDTTDTVTGTALPGGLPGTSGGWTVATGGAGTCGLNDCNFTYWVLSKNGKNDGFFVHVPPVGAAQQQALSDALVPVVQPLIESAGD